MVGPVSRVVVVACSWVVLMAAPGFAAEAPSKSSEKMSELERYVRIQIEIGAAMKDFFASMGPGAVNPPPDQREAMVEQVDQTVSSILKKYGLTTEEYNRRKREVFEDDAAVESFLNAHPDLKTQWDALPFKGAGHGRRPYQ
ncbi:MAG: hypothetical protein ACOYXR_11485 [Nitrospirota bacterium]